MVDPRYFAPADIVGAYSQGLQFRQQQEEAQNKRRLADLLPQAVHGDQSAIDQIAQIDPRLFMQLDERQREQAKAEVADLGAAVRWADTPEKWAYVQQHYAQSGLDLSQYGFQDRERGLVALGQIGQYLESAPKPEYRAVEAGGSLIDVSGGDPRVVIAPNPGGHQTGAPVQSGGVSEGATATNPQTGEKIIYRNGQWEPMGGSGGNAGGGFPY